MATVVDLKVDRNLLCHNFDGYKLSFDPVPIVRQDIEDKPLKYEMHESEYSRLHTELFARHNLLFSDPWSRSNTYFVNTNHEVVYCSYDEIRGKAREPLVVYKMQFEDNVDGHYKPGDYNYTLRFISEKYCVLCDGKLNYFLLETGDRRRHTDWRLVTQARVTDNTEFRGFVLYDARLDIMQERKRISLVSGHLTRSKSMDRYVVLLTWSYWALENQKAAVWKYFQREELQITGGVYYCAFEPRSESIIVCSNGQLKTTAATRTDALEEIDKFSFSEYFWTQTENDIVVRLFEPAFISLEDYEFSSSPTTVKLKLYGQTLLSGSLYARVRDDLTSIRLEDDRAMLKMVKEKPGIWPQLILSEDEDADEDDPFEEGVEEEPESSEAEPELRFNITDSEITHKISLGYSPPLFTTTLRAGYPAAFATREGVDAALWLQSYQPVNPSDWKVRHEGNLHAFGYVQASKQQRKFTDCCPDLEFAVIAEAQRHVYIYKPHNESAGGLRNRYGPQVMIGKQHLVTLDEDMGEILGMATATNLITLLTAKAVLFLQV
ncbi:hypothetical protein AWZ03_012437 [Drosophila navojoa]|uniref:NudC domain-containing protein 1 n=1 Tax=Drosophila navojoa TaxID=7232 RepID=A0A484AX04_DRONA|nr:hypothetical protein AWZ03_012437 [Drosophila navojoa]